MAIPHNLAVVINNPTSKGEFLLVKQTPPPKFNDPEYDSFLDSDLWDLPCAPLKPLDSSSDSQIVIQVPESCSHELNLSTFDLNSALHQVLEQVKYEDAIVEWSFLNYVEEPEFGPGLTVKTVYIAGTLGPKDGRLKDAELCKWMSTERCMSMLVEVKPGSDRVGSLVVVGLLNDSQNPGTWKIPHALRFQEYPPGVKVIPMGSRTAKPFHTTNLIVFLGGGNDGGCDDSFIFRGEALIVDPGCKSSSHEQLKEIIAGFPRKLVVFVTHHHHDHVDGLSVVQKHNPDACLLGHENTIRRIGKDDWSLPHISVSGSEEICIGGQRLRIILAPGHTDGHMALLHVSTNSLIVGDHCVGQGSSLLDIGSGGNMRDYFQTTYNFIELSPHTLIPMHGRINMWPKHMLCGYLKNRRRRESTILKAIENGAKTLFDIVAWTYADVDRSAWVYASSNVRLHVDHLAMQAKLPNDFSLENFNRSCAEFAGKAVQWGRASMIDAERRLLANALLDISNERFILLSESCIPLFNFTTIYTSLTRSNQSFLGLFDDHRKMGRGRYNKRMFPTVTISEWRKGSQWFEVHRDLAVKIVSDVTYYPVFKNHCTPPCYMDEHYLPTLVNKVCPELTSNWSVTWADWSAGGSHPTTFSRKDVTEEFLDRVRLNNCSFNGNLSSICFLFGRKFHPSTLQPLLRIAPKLLGFG